MIRILKHGKVNKVICKNCECEFTWEKEDSYYEGEHCEVTCVRCPDCGIKIIVRHNL